MKRVFVQCSTSVQPNAVRRETIDGVEHVIINSKTLPDDIVMNGGLYPAAEIAASFKSLERTLAPVEHPTDGDGRFLSANDPVALHNFYAGAFNQNVKRENGRVSVDKVINVQEALKTDRGRRLLDRVNELETSNDPRPVHTSVGVFLEVEEMEGPQTNAVGQEYEWIARNMVFDHDAILLDSVGAAQPDQGVGLAVNSAGDELEVQQALVTIDADRVEPMSHNEIRDALQQALKQPPINGDWVIDVFDSTFVFEAGDQTFEAEYIIDGRVAKIVNVPLPVVRDVTYVPKTNEAGDAMKQVIVNALKEAGIETEGLDDSVILAKYNELLASTNASDGDSTGNDKADIAEVVANAVKPLVEKVEQLECKLNSSDEQERDELAELIGNSEKYAGLDVDSAKKLGVETLKDMAATLNSAHGIPLTVVNSSAGQNVSYEIPSMEG